MTRIVAGLAKGRRLAVPPTGTRPTSDRAREGLFNTLASTVRLDGARVLDLFAGTGAVGLEGLSRGADVAVLVESNGKTIEVLRRNVEAVGLPGAEVVASPVSRFLAVPPDEPFDLVFADPPYALEGMRVSGMLVQLTRGGWLSDNASVVIERSVRGDPGVATPVPGLTPFTERRYGETVLWYGRAR